jgi:hypothetical protein
MPAQSGAAAESVSSKQRLAALCSGRGAALKSLFTKPYRQNARSRRAVLVGLAGLAAIAAYALVMTVALPWLVERALSRYVAAGPERSATVERIRVNPFTLTAVLTSMDARDDQARISFAAPTIVLNLSMWSFVERRLILQRLDIEQPVLAIESTSLIDRIRALMAGARIEQLDLRDGRLHLVDRNATAERRLELQRITIAATGVDARPIANVSAAAGHMTLSAVDASGSEIDVEGVLPAGLAATSGLFSVNELDLEIWRPWLGTRLAALAPRGVLALSGSYQITTLLNEPALSIVEARAELDNLRFELAPDLRISAPRLVARMEASATPPASARIDLNGASFELSDARTQLSTPVVFDGVIGTVSIEAARAGALEFALEGRLVDGGRATVTAQLPASRDSERTLALALADVSPAALSPYAAALLGREIGAGRTDFELEFVERGRRIDGVLRIVSRGLAFAEPDAAMPSTIDASRLDLAAALLEDPHGIIELELPFNTFVQPRGIRSILSAALRTRVTAITAMPFFELGALVESGRDTLRAVPFEPGAAGLEAQAQITLDALAAALRERPRVALRVLGGFDALADRDALARQQIELHVQLASADPSPQARPQPVDFASPRAQDVLDEFAGERLPAAQLAAIAARFDCSDTSDATCRTAYYAAVFDALVANETIANGTLSRLGRFRAQSVAEALVERGIAADRISVGTGAPMTIAGAVGLPVEVDVYRQSEL